MLYIVLFFTGFLLSPFAYAQSYIYQLLFKNSNSLKPSLSFIFTSFIFTCFMFVSTFYFRGWLFSAYSIYFVLIYLFIYCLVYEIYSFIIHGKKLKSLDINEFMQFFLIVSGIYVFLIIYNKDWMSSLIMMLGTYFGFLTLVIFAQNLYKTILDKYCHPVLKNPVLGLLISFFLSAVYYLIFLSIT